MWEMQKIDNQRGERLQSFVKEQYGSYNYGLFLKYLLQWVLLLGVHYLVFWYFTNSGNLKLTGSPICPANARQCNNATSNVWVAIFYCIFCWYFSLSALQIKRAWPEIRNIKTLRRKVSLFNSVLVRLYRAVPFMLELQVIMDWGFTKTSLDIFQWFKFSDIYACLYLSKYTYTAYRRYGLGSKMAFCYKFLISSIGITLMILLIVGPMIIFSSLNPIASGNKISGASVAFGLVVNQGANSFELFSTSQTVSLEDVNLTLFRSEKLNLVEEIKAADLTTLQYVTLQNYTDTEWRPTTQANDRLLEYLNPTGTITKDIKFYLSYSFNRNYKSDYAKSLRAFQQDISLKTRSEMRTALESCSTFRTVLYSFYKKVIRLPAEQAPKIIGESDTNIPYENVSLLMNCSRTSSARTYSWELSLNHSGLQFLTWSDQVTTVILGYSAITLYISVVVVIGNLIKGITRGGSIYIIIEDMPEPDELLNLCEGVIIYRLDNNLRMYS